MIETDAQTEADLREAVRLATSYAIDSLGVTTREELEKIPREHFMARCHEGLGLAQKTILKNLLPLEQSLKELRAKIHEQSKGKKKKELQRDEAVHALRREETRLVGVTLAFRRVADTIAWQILRFNKVLMRSTHTSHGNRGYLSDTNITSAVEAIADLQTPEDFYLINDLTLCLGSGAGDLLHSKVDRSCSFIELKSGAENARILDFLHGYGERVEAQSKKIADGEQPRSPEECQIHQFLSEHSDLLTDRDKQKQLGRVVRQMDRMHSVLEYDRLNIGKDISLTAKGKSVERNRLAIVMKTEDEHAFAEINNALASVSNEPSHVVLLDYGPLVTFLVTDNLKSELFSEGLSPFVREMNARHVIYHHIHDNLADCGYGKGPQEGAEELARYSRLFVLNWVTQVMRDGSLMPPFLMAIKRELMFDVLLGRKSIFVYFDGVQFAEFVNEIAAGKFTLTADGHADREWSGLQIKIPGRKTKGPSMLGWGVIFRMLIEFQGPETVRRQIVEMVEGEVSKFAAMKDTSPGVPKP